MAENHAGSPDTQINLAWRVYVAFLDNDQLDKRLIHAAKELAKSVSKKDPEEAIVLDVYAHLLYAAGKSDLAIKTFELALEKSNDQNRAEIESDYQEILKLIGK